MITLEAVSRVYLAGGEPVWALRDINVRIHAGEFVAVVGPASSGKSTLMNMIGCLDQPTTGRCVVESGDVRYEGHGPRGLRIRLIGHVLPYPGLLPHLTLAENVEMPLLYAGGVSRRARQSRALAALATVGLAERATRRAGGLPAGEQRLAAIARALVNEPAIVLADEPVHGLDQESADVVMELLTGLHQRGGTLVLATRDARLAQRATRMLRLRNGAILTPRRRSPQQRRRNGDTTE